MVASTTRIRVDPDSELGLALAASARTGDVVLESGTAAYRVLPAVPPPTPYDPNAETDPLVRAHIMRDSVGGEPVFRGIDYYVADVLIELQGTDYDYAEVLISYPELTRDDLDAAVRFQELHGGEPLGVLDEAV